MVWFGGARETREPRVLIDFHDLNGILFKTLY